MNWQAIYIALIEHRRFDQPCGYTERHHIVPRALGGGNDPDNIVRLTGREHFIAHCLLARIHGGVMWVALVRMKGRAPRAAEPRYTNSRLYDKAKAEWAAWSSANQRGTAHWAYGKPGLNAGKKSPKTTGDAHWNFGKKRTPEQIAAVVASRLGKAHSEDTRKMQSDAQLGEKNHRYGKEVTFEHRAKLSAAMIRFHAAKRGGL